MFGQVFTRVIVLSAVFLWTVQPANLGVFAAVEAYDTCSIELGTDVELAQLDVIYLPTQTANVTIHLYSATLPADDAVHSYETHIGSRLHLRGPPVVSFG